MLSTFVFQASRKNVKDHEDIVGFPEASLRQVIAEELLHVRVGKLFVGQVDALRA